MAADAAEEEKRRTEENQESRDARSATTTLAIGRGRTVSATGEESNTRDRESEPCPCHDERMAAIISGCICILLERYEARRKTATRRQEREASPKTAQRRNRPIAGLCSGDARDERRLNRPVGESGSRRESDGGAEWKHRSFRVARMHACLRVHAGCRGHGVSERLARFFFLLLVVHGIEPHPGPSPTVQALCPGGTCGLGSKCHGLYGDKNAVPQRYHYKCYKCKGTYHQIRHTALQPGDDRQAAWITRPKVQVVGLVQMVGDERAGFQNVRSIMEDDIWKVYMYCHAVRNGIHGMCETWMTPELAADRADELLKSGYGRLYHVAGTERKSKTPGRGCGCALFVNAAITKDADEQCIYKKHDGRALGVHLTWKGVKLLVLVTHAPSDHHAQKKWFQRVREDLSDVYTRLPENMGDRACLWMSDNNLIVDPTKDERPARALLTGPETGAAEEMRLLGVALDATEDLYRVLQPNGLEVTHEQSGQTPRRLDTMKSSKRLLEYAGHGAPRVCSVRHVPKSEHECVYDAGTPAARLKPFDHRGVVLTFRVSDVPVQRKYTFPSEIIQTEGEVKHMASVMTEALRTAKAVQARVQYQGLRVTLQLQTGARDAASDLQQRMQQEVRRESEDLREEMWGKVTRERTAAAAKLKSAMKNPWPEKAAKKKEEARVAADEALREADRARARHTRLQTAATLTEAHRTESVMREMMRAAGEASRIARGAKAHRQAEIQRAKRREAEAVMEVQRLKLARRTSQTAEEYWDESAAASRVFAKRPHTEAVTSMKTWERDQRGDKIPGTEQVETTPEGVRRAMREGWEPTFNKEPDPRTNHRAARIAEQMAKVRNSPARLTKELQKIIEMEAVLSIPNLTAAAKSLQGHTSPGEDGLPTDVYAAVLKLNGEDWEILISHLRRLYKEIYENGCMPKNMREFITSMLYKDKGDKLCPDSYRPISVMSAEYRILARAMAQRLALVLYKVIGRTQIGFVLGHQIGENIDLMTEIIRYMENEGKESQSGRGADSNPRFC